MWKVMVVLCAVLSSATPATFQTGPIVGNCVGNPQLIREYVPESVHTPRIVLMSLDRLPCACSRTVCCTSPLLFPFATVTCTRKLTLSNFHRPVGPPSIGFCSFCTICGGCEFLRLSDHRVYVCSSPLRIPLCSLGWFMQGESSIRMLPEHHLPAPEGVSVFRVH